MSSMPDRARPYRARVTARSRARGGTNESSPRALSLWTHGRDFARPRRGRRPRVMNITTLSPLDLVFLGVSILTLVYWLAAMACVAAFRRQPLGATHFSPPVTLLKPLRGD